MKEIMERPVPLGPHNKVSFVIAPTRQGTFIVNRMDYLVWKHTGDNDWNVAGVGGYLLEGGAYDEEEAQLSCQLLDFRRKHHGAGVVAMDCGANIGVFSVVWGRHMGGWGQVLAVEAQERLFYALCGNVALNNCLNVQAIKLAISDRGGWIPFTEPDYTKIGSFGALNIRDDAGTKQEPDARRATGVQSATIDSFQLSRLDFLKIDLEGMECEALRGATETITRCRPVISIEVMLDSDNRIEPILRELGYLLPHRVDGRRQVIVWHRDDPISADLAA